MGRIFVLAASRMEADPVAEIFGVTHWDSASTTSAITVGRNQLEFFITGMGPRKAGERVAEILSDGSLGSTSGDLPDKNQIAVIVIGLCGGLIESLPEMTIVSYSSCLTASNAGMPCSSAPQISSRVEALLRAHHLPYTSVVGITSPRIAVTRDDKLQLAKTGAQVVDMESYEILSAAQKFGVPAAIVRIVSDSLERKLPDLNRALNPDGSVSVGKAILAMLGSPILTARAYTANKRAARHLAEALQPILSANIP